MASYKGVLAPASRREGLRIKTFELQATDRPEHFRYKILLSRVGKGETPLEGQLQVSIVGKQAGQDVTLRTGGVERRTCRMRLPEQPISLRLSSTFRPFPRPGDSPS